MTFANVLQVAALVAFISGAFVLALWFGLMVLGAGLAFVGYAIDPDRVGGSE